MKTESRTLIQPDLTELIGVCTNPDAFPRCFWSAKSTDEKCDDPDCGGCLPVFYVAAPQLEQEVERLRRRYRGQETDEMGAVVYERAECYRHLADRLEALLTQDPEREGESK